VIASHSPGILSIGQIPAFYPAVLLRSLIMLAIIGVLLFKRSPGDYSSDHHYFVKVRNRPTSAS